MSQVERILVYRLGSLGDMCVAVPALRTIRRSFPNAQIHLLTNFPVSKKAAPAWDVLEGSGLVDAFIPYPVGTRRVSAIASLLRQLRRNRYETVVNLSSWRGMLAGMRDRIFFGLSGAQSFLGFGRQGAELRGLTDGRVETEAERLSRRVLALGPCDALSFESYSLAVTPEESGHAGGLRAANGISGPYFVFSIGAKMPAKRWDPKRWRALLELIGREFGYLSCVAIGSTDEYGEVAGCMEGFTGASANFCGKLSPRQSAAMIAQAQFFVGNDSGPMHLAAGVGVRCVIAFSARSKKGQWYPLGRNHEVLYRDVSCASCGLEICTTEGLRCLTEISIDDMMAAVRRILGLPPIKDAS